MSSVIDLFKLVAFATTLVVGAVKLTADESLFVTACSVLFILSLAHFSMKAVAERMAMEAFKAAEAKVNQQAEDFIRGLANSPTCWSHPDLPGILITNPEKVQGDTRYVPLYDLLGYIEKAYNTANNSKDQQT
jgi:hypothetical protein